MRHKDFNFLRQNLEDCSFSFKGYRSFSRILVVLQKRGDVVYASAMLVLGIESSCDETAAAVVEHNAGTLTLRSNVVHSQVPQHAIFGGVVPEVASREHIARIAQLVQNAVEPVGGLEKIDGVAVTRGPGLVGSLLVGLQFAKGLALARDLPWVGVNHLEGHLSAALLDAHPPSYPHLALIVSGGHTHLYHVQQFGRYEFLGGTLDDAAGEAFDKVAKLLGLGYPGGVQIERHSQGGDPNAFKLPRALPQRDNFSFSFSGVKTAAHTHVKKQNQALQGQALQDFCASFQEAIVDVLSRKAVLAAQSVSAPGIVLAGGVAANSRLRAVFSERCARHNLWLYAPPKPLCTDNAAMIAAAGSLRLAAGEKTGLEHTARSRWPLNELNPASA